MEGYYDTEILSQGRSAAVNESTEDADSNAGHQTQSG